MPTISVPQIVDGVTPANDVQFALRFGPITTVVNGGMNDANIQAGSVTSEKLGINSITASKFAQSESWKTPVWQNGWGSYSAIDPGWPATAHYFKDTLGRVYLRSLIRAGTIDRAAFTLPVGYRPSRRVLFYVMSSDNVGRVDVTPDGEVIPVFGNNNWVALDGINFSTV